MAMADYYDISMFSLVSEKEGDYNEKFNANDTVNVYRVNGSLADDVRKRWKLAEDVEVLMTEEIWVNGYSEYTRDDDYVFTISAANKEAMFHSIGDCETFLGIR